MCFHRFEPTIADVLSDGVVRAVMTADGVNATKLEAFLREMAAKLANDHRRPEPCA
jgi:hypothetical protein